MTSEMIKKCGGKPENVYSVFQRVTFADLEEAFKSLPWSRSRNSALGLIAHAINIQKNISDVPFLASLTNKETIERITNFGPAYLAQLDKALEYIDNKYGLSSGFQYSELL